jgi:hypothetical protein
MPVAIPDTSPVAVTVLPTTAAPTLLIRTLPANRKDKYEPHVSKELQLLKAVEHGSTNLREKFDALMRRLHSTDAQEEQRLRPTLLKLQHALESLSGKQVTHCLRFSIAAAEGSGTSYTTHDMPLPIDARPQLGMMMRSALLKSEDRGVYASVRLKKATVHHVM